MAQPPLIVVLGMILGGLFLAWCIMRSDGDATDDETTW